MIQVVGQNRSALLTGLTHHAAPMVPFRQAFNDALLYQSTLAEDTNTHILRQGRTGVGSWGLLLSDGRRFYFRSEPPYDKVIVYDRANNGRSHKYQVAILLTPDDLFDWVSRL